MGNGRKTLVTGARSGMGRAVADLLRSRGETVIGLDLADCAVNADLSHAEGRQSAAREVERLCDGSLDAIVACAGVAVPDGELTVSVNYFGVTDLIDALHPLLTHGTDPRAVVVSSSASMLETDAQLVDLCLVGDEPAARARARDNPVAYSSSKLAVSRWIRRTAIADGWAANGILLNGVAPGLVLTPMTLPMFETEEGRETLRQGAPYCTPEPGRPEEIAPLLAFMASTDNRYCVGQVPFCDGGKDVLLRGDDVLRPA